MGGVEVRCGAPQTWGGIRPPVPFSLPFAERLLSNALLPPAPSVEFNGEAE